MAKTENNQESRSPEIALTKTLLVNEHSNDTSVIASREGECIFVKTNCPHVNKAIDINQVRKSINTNGGFTSLRCISCKTNPVIGDDGKVLELCMRCGECCCTNHVQRHFEKPRSDSHLLYVNINHWGVKCMDCDVNIPADQSGKLGCAIKLLEDLQNKSKSNVNILNPDPASASTALEPIVSPVFACQNSEMESSLAVTVGTKPTSPLLPPRGLFNLGNTCFFNSVLQCLARTPFLVETLLEMKEPGEKITLKLESYVPVKVELQEKWGSVTENFVSTLLQITTQTGNAYSPAHLLDALRKKHMQFMGFNQHDAHELLRTLLDCVKNEDMRRYRFEILRHFGLTRKTNPNEVDENKKALAKEMDKKLTELVNIRPDPVFRGFTVSANQCIKCNHKSEIPESFLDLSLPVSFLRLQPLSMARRKNDFADKPKSKHQLKKERKLARKNKKLGYVKKRCAVSEDQKNKNRENLSIEIKDVNESGYSSGKASSPVQSGSDTATSNENNNEILAEALSEVNATPPSNVIDDFSVNASVKSENDLNSPSSETPYDEGTTTGGSSADPISTEPLNNGDEVASTSTTKESESPQHALTEIATTSGCALVNSPDQMSNNLGSSSSGDDDLDEDNDAGDSDDDESIDDNVLDAVDMKARGLCATLQPPSIDDDEENSIWACLREYTKCEVLTGNNKVVCEKCTKEYNKNTGEKKQIYRNFTKQLLVKSPPPVLILHLKRFEAKGAFSFRKVDTNISFPLTLDIGSFCSVTCERLLYANQKNILYSLYGIVEHSGSLNAGHYVAYVKVRNTNKHSYRRLFLPKSMHNETESVNGQDMERIMNELKNEERQWYHISDSSVRFIAEEDVLRKQAYLLFYERIW